MGDAQTSPKKLINLLKGWPNPSLLPITSIAKASQSALSDPQISIPGLCYGPDPGYQPLREEISKWLAKFYSPHPASQSSPPPPNSSQADEGRGADRICITGGASQNLACILQVYTDPVTTRVWMVAPCYYLACNVFDDAGLRCGAVGEGTDGIDLEELDRRILEAEKSDGGLKALKHANPWSKIYRHIIYCVPTFSNPSGKTMPLSQRQKLVQLARKYDALIITDDVYDFLQWPTTSNTTISSLSKSLLPRLVDVDRTLDPIPATDSFGNAMSNGSFSKITGPGVRTGWAEATPKFTYGLSQCGSSRSGGAPSQLVATMMAELLKTGDLQNHILGVLQPAYKKRYDVIIEAIQTHLLPLGIKLGEVSFGEKDVFGGYFIWVKLPMGVSAIVVMKKAKEVENLIVAPGRSFEVRGDASVKFENEIRLCFAWEAEEDLVDGVARLGGVVKALNDARVEGRDCGENKEGLEMDLGEFK